MAALKIFNGSIIYRVTLATKRTLLEVAGFVPQGVNFAIREQR
jgi:hypothetical protein